MSLWNICKGHHLHAVGPKVRLPVPNKIKFQLGHSQNFANSQECSFSLLGIEAYFKCLYQTKLLQCVKMDINILSCLFPFLQKSVANVFVPVDPTTS